MSPRAREATRRANARQAKRPARRPESRFTPAEILLANAGRTTTGNLRLSAGGARFARFSYRLCRHWKGRLAGQPIALEAWQLEIVSEIFKRERETWLTLSPADLVDPWAKIEAFLDRSEFDTEIARVHREALVGLPKKNGKSTLFSAAAIYLTVADGEPGAEVYAAAAAKPQARIVFDGAVKMVKASPKLSDLLRPLRDRIETRDGDSFFQVLSADADVQEGINPHAIVIDELHAHKTRRLYDTLTTATIGRDRPLVVSITTAGVDLAGTIGGEVFIRGAGTARPAYRNGVVVPTKTKSRSFYFHWRGVPETKKNDRAAWKLANPLSAITLDRLVEESEKPRPWAIFARYHLNVWTRIESHLFTPAQIVRLRRPKLRLVAGETIVVGVDVGLFHDTFAVVWGRPPKILPNDPDFEKAPEAEKLVVVRSRVFGVHPDPKKPAPPADVIVDGEGPLDFGVVETFILDELAQTFRIREIVYDPYKFARSAELLGSKGLLCVSFDQGHARMVPASEMMFRYVAKAWLATGGPALDTLERHFEATAAKDVGGGRFRLDKVRARNPMDASIAGAMMLDRALAVPPARPTIEVI